jgi:hypothetical protein
MWCIIDGLITVRDGIFIMETSPLLQIILEHAHGTRHKGTEKTLHHLRADFHIPGVRGLVREFVRAYEICKWNKGEQLWLVRLLQPLDVPSVVWDDVAMDFVEGFPASTGNRWYSPSSTAYQSLRTSFLLATHTP